MATSESFRQDVSERLNRICSSSDDNASATFPNCLSAEERKYIHNIAEQFGLRHVSQGKGDDRRITVTKDLAKSQRRGLVAGGHGQTGGSSSLRLPPEAWGALDHPLIRHASKSGNLEALSGSALLLAVGPAEVQHLLGGRGVLGDTAHRMPKPGDAFQLGAGPPQTELLSTRQRLPAWALREEVLRAVAANRVVIIEGATGCGKSTQVPQFLLESADQVGNIIVTQPRRLSALGLAHRVAQERGQEVGQLVGYSVHLDNCSCQSTRLLFCTTGVFRRRLLAEPSLPGVTHLVFDELHERDKITDFMLITVRELLDKRPDLKVILMSATMEKDTFRKYFAGCSTVCIPGRTFPVCDYFLEDLAPRLHELGRSASLGPGFAAGGLGFGTWADKGNEKSFKYQVLVSQARNRDGLCGFGYNASKPLSGQRFEEGLFLHDVLQQTKGVQFDLPIIEAVIVALAEGHELCLEKAPVATGKGGILVFLPGWDDIDRLKKRLAEHPLLGDKKRFWVLPLHSQVRLEEQREVFRAPPLGIRKVVLSTNIAETSITIDDIEVVIDCGRAKELSYDCSLRVPTLNTSWVSRASVKQRAGRAGRTAPGVCLHIFSKRRAEMLVEHRPPEMLRSALEDLCLHAKLLLTRQGNPDASAASYLRLAPDPPDERSVLSAEMLLKEIGALTGGGASESSASTSGRLTALGVHLSVLPLQPQFAKIVVWANLFGVGDDALAVLGCLQYRDPFVSIGQEWRPTSFAEANRSVRSAKYALCGSDGCSDHLALLRATEGFQTARAQGGDAARQFCRDNCLSFHSMTSQQQSGAKLRRELAGRGLWSELSGRHSGDFTLLSAALCAGLFPNVAHRPQGGKGKLQANNGRLQALPHSSSIASFAKGGKDLWDSWGNQGTNHVDEDGQAQAEVGDSWMCFNELSQVEDHYSLSGLTTVPTTAILLLCGESDLVIQELEHGDYIDDGGTGDAYSDFWEDAMKVGERDAGGGGGRGGGGCGSSGSRAGGPKNHNSESVPPDRVSVSILELGGWFSVQLRRETAARLQALRSMLRLLFRALCSDSSHLQDLVGEGTVGAVVLELAARVMRGEAGRQRAEEPQSVSGPSRSGAGAHRKATRAPAVPVGRPQYSERNGNAELPGHSGFGRYPHANVTQRAQHNGQSGAGHPRDCQRGFRHCESCLCPVAETQGGLDTSSGAWYCAWCWQGYDGQSNVAHPRSAAAVARRL
mmetsp:Transcript_117708/g.375150  ORF Transcript_117708/g.375150 Transcript_117708/m.375150 type:complete len:1223 (+) Transcript_117708:59-3727(+)